MNGNGESCPIATPQAGTYYIMINAYAAYSGLSLQASWSASGGTTGGTTGGSALSSGVPVTGLSGATGSNKNYTFAVPSGASTVTVQISGGTGDADLYVRFGA